MIVICWHVNPPDSCLLFKEMWAICECENLKKTLCMEIGATHATQSVIFTPEHACSCSRNTHLDTKAGVAAGRVCGCFLTCEIIFPALTPETDSSLPVFPKLLCVPVASNEKWLIPTDTHAHISSTAAYLWGHPSSSHSLRGRFLHPAGLGLVFRPVIPVNLMLQHSLQQSITAKTTKSSPPAG